MAARRGRLRALADAGNRRALVALRLKDAPDEFMATVQVGITLVGTLASAIGGVAAVERLEPVVAALPWPWASTLAEPVAVGVVVFTIAYLSLVVGELVPKSLAVRHSEAIAVWVAPVIEAVRHVARPAITVLTWTSRRLSPSSAASRLQAPSSTPSKTCGRWPRKPRTRGCPGPS